MRNAKRTAGGSLLLILVISGLLYAQGKNPEGRQRSSRAFVQEFYAKFVQAHKTNIPPPYPFERALSPEIRRRLEEDEEAQRRDTSGFIVGLDFDPIAAGNDIYDRYEVGRVTRKGGRYFVEVFCLWGNKRDERQKMVHEIMVIGGRWTIMNIHYYHYETGKPTRHSNLLGILKSLREERRKNSR